MALKAEQCEQSEGNTRAATTAPVELQERIRVALAGKTSRRALGAFGVSGNTLCAALAGMPVGKGSLALIREELARRDAVAAEGQA